MHNISDKTIFLPPEDKKSIMKIVFEHHDLRLKAYKASEIFVIDILEKKKKLKLSTFCLVKKSFGKELEKSRITAT